MLLDIYIGWLLPHDVYKIYCMGALEPPEYSTYLSYNIAYNLAYRWCPGAEFTNDLTQS